jgi:hypothetical protein
MRSLDSRIRGSPAWPGHPHCSDSRSEGSMVRSGDGVEEMELVRIYFISVVKPIDTHFRLCYACQRQSDEGHNALEPRDNLLEIDARRNTARRT